MLLPVGFFMFRLLDLRARCNLALFLLRAIVVFCRVILGWRLGKGIEPESPA